MKHVLTGLLVVSIGVNVWFLASGDSDVSDANTAQQASPEAADPNTADAPTRNRVAAADEPSTPAEPTPSQLEELRATTERVTKLQNQIDSLDPLAWLLYSDKPLAWKARKVLEIEDEKTRNMAAWKLGGTLGEDEGSAQLLLDALRAETDADVLGVLAQIIRGGGMNKAPDAVRRQFVDVLNNGDTPAHRLVAVRAVFMSEAFRGGFGGDVKEFANEMNSALVNAITHESSPEVVGAIANAMAAWFPTPEAIVALKDAAGRLPASPGRREAWMAIGRGTFRGDRGASMIATFRETSDQSVRDDIAAGIARGGNSMAFGGRGGRGAEGAEEQMRNAQEQVRTLFEGTSDADVRRGLLRASLMGLSCLPPNRTSDEGKATMGRFYRELAALDPDADQRTRIEALATALETDGFQGTNQFREIMYADE